MKAVRISLTLQHNVYLTSFFGIVLQIRYEMHYF